MDFKESMKMQEKEVQKVLKLFELNGPCVLLKKEFADDNMKKNMSKAILFLLDVIKNKDGNKIKQEEEAQTSNEEKVATDPKEISKKEKKNLAKENGKCEESAISKETKSVCFAYRFNKCPFVKEDCQNRHPKKCQKFCDYGHIAVDEKGCDTKKCDLLHPKLCRNSTSTKECPHKICRFQHLKGTKYVPKAQNRNAKFHRDSKTLECGAQDVLINKFDKLMEMLVKLIQNQDEGKKILRPKKAT